MAKSSSNEARIDIGFFEGVNAAVQSNLAKKTELAHVENARAPIVGVLEKRQGQTKVGTATNGAVFYTTANYGLAKFKVTDETYQGVFRASVTHTFSNTLTLSVFDDVNVIDYQGVVSQTTIYVRSIDYVTVSEPGFFRRLDDGTILIDGTSSGTSIYSLTQSNTWSQLSDASAQNLIGSNFNFSNADGSLIMVNGRDYNRMISSDGVTVIDSTEAGSLYNSPRATKVSFYKNRIYLANFKRNAVQYKTTILRSSYPLGIIALVNGDQATHASATALNVTDAKYFYSDTGMNSYEVYRGSTLISTITVTTVNETSITVTHSGTPTFNSSDEIWITGTYTGTKQYRWVNNPTSTGKDVKQYDTFKLSGGEEDEITLFEPIGNILLVGNKNTLMTWNDYTLENFDLGVGCAAPNGYGKLLGTLYFLHYSGVYATTGTVPILVSRKVERYIKGATKAGIENGAVGVKGLSVFFAIGDVTLYNADGSFWKTMPNVCLEYNVADKNWYVHTKVPASQFITFINSSGAERLLMSHTGGGNSIKEFLVGNTDDEEEIFFRADTQEIQFMKEFEYSVHPTTIVTELDRGTMMKTMVSLDGDDFYEISGINEKGATSLRVTARDAERGQLVICRRLRISFRDSSKQLCRIRQAAVIYTPTPLTTPE